MAVPEIISPKVNNRKGGRRGGARPGAGNHHVLGGGVNSLKNEVLTLRAKYGKMPLDHMLKVLNTDIPEIPDNLKPEEKLLAYKVQRNLIARQDWAAEHAAPYMHAKLASIEITQGGAPVQTPVDLTLLNNAELDQLERLVQKASVVVEDGEYVDVSPKK